MRSVLIISKKVGNSVLLLDFLCSGIKPITVVLQSHVYTSTPRQLQLLKVLTDWRKENIYMKENRTHNCSVHSVIYTLCKCMRKEIICTCTYITTLISFYLKLLLKLPFSTNNMDFTEIKHFHPLLFVNLISLTKSSSAKLKI